jgi:tRNA pseudouridine38-40 synthase
VPRYRITVEYDGTPFYGWQRQEGIPSVQQTIEEAVLKLSGETVSVRGAGRTDTGVHALGQVAHLDLSREWATDRIRDGLNAHLRPAPVVVLAAEAVADDFDARYSATRRHYVYRILNRRSPPALARDRVWHLTFPLDAEAMAVGARALLGRHDFSTFRAAECQAKSPVKTLDQLDVIREGDEIRVLASARSFLMSQVRSMVGSLAQVGSGRWPASRMAEILAGADRTLCGPLAPPHGLYLARVDY